MNDPIVDEVRRVREEHAARFNFDLDAIFCDTKEQEKLSGRKIVNYTRETPVGPESTPLPTPTVVASVPIVEPLSK